MPALLQSLGRALTCVASHLGPEARPGDVYAVLASSAEAASMSRALDILQEEEAAFRAAHPEVRGAWIDPRDYEAIDPEAIAADRVAAELHSTVSHSRRVLGDAVLLSRCTRVWNSALRGALPAKVAVRIARELEHVVDPEKLAEIEARILTLCEVEGRTARWSSGSTRKLHAIINAVDPDALKSGEENAARGRGVRRWSQAPGEAVVCADLPALEAEAVWSAVDGLAGDWGRMDGESRTAAQRRADALVQLVTGIDKRPAGDRTPIGAHSSNPAITLVAHAGAEEGRLRAFGGSGSAVKERLDELLSASRRASLSVVPFQADDSGPDLHRLSRELVEVAERIAAETTYAPSAAMRRLVVQRDGTCRHPGCEVAAARCDLDHVRPFSREEPLAGGLTREDNLIALCRHHHRAKTHGSMQYELRPDGRVRASLGGMPLGESAPNGPRGIERQSLGLEYAVEPPDYRTALRALADSASALGSILAPGVGPGEQRFADVDEASESARVRRPRGSSATCVAPTPTPTPPTPPTPPTSTRRAQHREARRAQATVAFRESRRVARNSSARQAVGEPNSTSGANALAPLPEEAFFVEPPF